MIPDKLQVGRLFPGIQSSRACKRRRGFTLLELIVVMVILALLASGVSVIVVRRVAQARIERAKADIQNLSNALEQYKIDNLEYPGTDQGLDALVHKPTGPPEPPSWSSRYIKILPRDPWGTPFHYQHPGMHNEDGFDVWSLGKDGKEGGEGENADITNWTDGDRK